MIIAFEIMFLLGIISWLIAIVLNALIFTKSPASNVVAIILSIIVFLPSMYIGNALYHEVLEYSREQAGIPTQGRMQPNLGSQSGIVAAIIFYYTLRRRKNKKLEKSIQLKTEGTDIGNASREVIKDSMPDNPSKRPHYETAWREIEQEQTDMGIWSEAFAFCEGDEAKTKAMYIELRVANLLEIERR